MSQKHSNQDSQNTVNTTLRVEGRLLENHPNSSTHASVKCSLLDHGWAQQHTSNNSSERSRLWDCGWLAEGCVSALLEDTGPFVVPILSTTLSPHAVAWCVYIVLHPVPDSLLGSL